MTSESNRKSAASISYVDGVCRAWGWSFTPTAPHDDDGLDGLVYIRVEKRSPENPDDQRTWKHEFTGGIIHVQIKSGTSYISEETQDYLAIKVADFETKRSLWEKSTIPVALIYVMAEKIGARTTKAWWADLKSPASYTLKDTILVPKKNRFQAGIECRRPFGRLASRQLRLVGLESIDMSSPWKLPSKLDQRTKGLKHAAREFYSNWKSLGAVNPDLGRVIVNRTGWSHMTRVGRPLSRIDASYELLPAAARIIDNVKNWKVLRRGGRARLFPDDSWAIYDYLGLSAMVKWPARASSEVMVILKRQTILARDQASSNPKAMTRTVDTKIWLYSVYEPGRRRI